MMKQKLKSSILLGFSFLFLMLFTANVYGANVTVKVTKSNGTTAYSGVTVQYLDGYWRSFGTTNGSGEVSKTLSDGTYDFRATVGGTTSGTQSHTVSGNYNLSFQTSLVTVHVEKSDNSDFQGVSTQYHAGYWRTIGNTDVNGNATVEIFDGTYDFRASIGGTTSPTKNESVSGNTTVNFQTSLATFNTMTSGSSALSGVTMQYHAGYWRTVGNTNGSGTVTEELFPGTYNTRASLGGTSAEQNITLNSPGSVTYYTTKVTAKAEDCDNNDPIPGVTMQYHSGYWRTIGSTNGSGETSKELFPGTFDFRGSIGGTTSANQSHTIPGDGTTSGESTTVVFSPTRIEFTYNGSLQYYSGYWRTLSNPDYLFPGTYNFKFDGTVLSLSVSGCSLSDIIFIICVLNSDGDPFPGIKISHNNYGNHYNNLGTTNSDGILMVTSVPSGPQKFRANKNYSNQYMTSSPGKITFQTSKFTAHVKHTGGTDFSGIETEYNDYGNHWIDLDPKYTDGNGKASIELFPGNYNFRAKKNYSYQKKSLEITTSGTSDIVVFQTSTFIAHVLMHDGSDFPGIETEYNDYGNHWIDLDPKYTDGDGKASIELFPDNFNFRAKKNYSYQEKSLEITTSGTSDIVTFQTALAIGLVKDCDLNSPVSGIEVEYNDYGNHWIDLDPKYTGSDGKASIELFPGTFDLRAKTIYTYQTKQIVLSGPTTTVEFNPTRVCIQNSGTVKYNDYGNHWRNIPCNTYMFPGTYDFRIGTEELELTISGCAMNGALITVIDENDNGVEGATAEPACGGSWQGVLPGTTDANGFLFAYLPSCYTKIRVRANQTSEQQTVSQLNSSNFTYTTEIVRVNLLDHSGNPITDEEGELEQGGGSWYDWGSFNSSGYLDIQVFSGSNVKFKAHYNCTSDQKSGIAVASGAGIQEIDFQTGQVNSSVTHNIKVVDGHLLPMEWS